jgi:hypothetical protein
MLPPPESALVWGPGAALIVFAYAWAMLTTHEGFLSTYLMPVEQLRWK